MMARLRYVWTVWSGALLLKRRLGPLQTGVFVCLAAGIVAARQPDSGEGWTPAAVRMSSSQHFVVTSTSGVEAVSIATWADDITEKLTEWFDCRIPFRYGERLKISLRDDPDLTTGKVAIAQGYIEGRFRQHLNFWNPAQISMQDANVNLCRLLLGRMLSYGGGHSHHVAQIRHAPEWLVWGAAGMLNPRVRIEAMNQAHEHWLKGEVVSLKALFQHTDTKTLNETYRVYAVAAVYWLTSEEPALLNHLLFSEIAYTQDVEVRERSLQDFSDWREVEQAWEVWLVSRRQVLDPWMHAGRKEAVALEQMRVIPPEVLSVFSGRVFIRPKTLGGLLEYRKEPWIESLCEYWLLKMEGLGLRRFEKFRPVLDAYRRYLAAVPDNGAQSPDPLAVLQLLKEADKAQQILNAELLKDGSGRINDSGTLRSRWTLPGKDGNRTLLQQ